MTANLEAASATLPTVIVEAVRLHLIAAGVIAPDHPFDAGSALDGADETGVSLGYMAQQIAIFGAGLYE